MYGIYKICAKYKQHRSELLSLIFQAFIVKDGVDLESHLTSKKIWPSADNDELKSVLFNVKSTLEHDRAMGLCNIFTTRAIKHKCNESGLLTPSKKELKEACAMAKANWPDTVSELLAQGRIKDEFVQQLS